MLLSVVLLAWVPLLLSAATDGSWDKVYANWETTDYDPQRDVVIPIVTPLSNHGCGPTRYMMMRIAADNMNNRDHTFAPAIQHFKGNWRIKHKVVDNMNSGSGTLDALNLLAAKVTSATTTPGSTTCGDNSKIKAVLGPNSSGNSKMLSTVLQTWNVPHLSWAATNGDLSNTNVYPNFFRVVGPDSDRVQVILQYFNSFGLKKFHILHSDDDYSTGEMKFTVNQLGRAKDINTDFALEISSTLKFEIDDENKIVPAGQAQLDMHIAALKKSPIRAVAIFSMSGGITAIAKALYDQDLLADGFMFVGTDGCASQSDNFDHWMGVHYFMPSTMGSTWDAFKTKWKADIATTTVPEFTNSAYGTCREFNTVTKVWDSIACTNRDNKERAKFCFKANKENTTEIAARSDKDKADVIKLECDTFTADSDAYFNWEDGAWGPVAKDIFSGTKPKCSGVYERLAYDGMLAMGWAVDRIMSNSTLNYQNDVSKITREDWMIAFQEGWTDSFEGLTGDIKLNKKGDRDTQYSINTYHQTGAVQGIGVSSFDKLEIKWTVGRKLYWPGGKKVTLDKATMTAAELTPPEMTVGQPQPCLVGQKFDVSTGICTSCPAGTKAKGIANDGIVHLECEECLPGQYQNLVGQSTCKNCDSGKVSEAAGATICVDCSPGEVASAGSVCTPCTAGKFSNDTSKLECDLCQAGTFSTAGSPSCTPCAKGSAAEEIMAPECKVCRPGQFADKEGMTSCKTCPLATYQPESSSSACLSCEAVMENSTTALMAATGETDCVCPAGSFRKGKAKDCLPCPEGVICPVGSDMANFNVAKAVSFKGESKDLPYPELLPQFYAQQDEIFSPEGGNLNIFRCSNEAVCPGGKDYLNPCGGLSAGRACSLCEKDAAYNGKECVTCSSIETSKFLFPALPIILAPCFVCFMYFMFRDMPEKWGNWKNGIASLVYLVLSHYQMISLINSVPLQLPSSMNKAWKVWAFSQDAISIFSPSCAGVMGFEGTFVSQSLVPIVLLLVCVATTLGSWVVAIFVPKVKMEIDRVINLYFAVIFAFYIGIASLSMSLFKCQTNPGRQKTLIQDLSIICYGETWNSVLGLAFACIIIYCLGSLVLYSWVIWIAPKRFMEASFQKRWKFLFIKYSGTEYWWGLPILAKGVWLNLGFVIVSNATGQIYWLMFTSMCYLQALFLCMPWRHYAANILDALVHLSVVCLLSISALYSDRDENDDKNMGTFAVVMASLPFFGLVVAVLSLVKGPYDRQNNKAQYDSRLQKRVATMISAYKTLGQLEAEEVTKLVESLDEGDRRLMFNTARTIDAELNANVVKRLTTGQQFKLGEEANKRRAAPVGGPQAEGSNVVEF